MVGRVRREEGVRKEGGMLMGKGKDGLRIWVGGKDRVLKW